jgi:hypothetical protein
MYGIISRRRLKTGGPLDWRLGEQLKVSRKMKLFTNCFKSRDSLVSMALGYGLAERGFRVRFPAGAGSYSLPHRVQNDSGSHSASYPMGTRGSFSGAKAAGA